MSVSLCCNGHSRRVLLARRIGVLSSLSSTVLAVSLLLEALYHEIRKRGKFRQDKRPKINLLSLQVNFWPLGVGYIVDDESSTIPQMG